MTLPQRIAIAIIVVLIDVVAFALPLFAIAVAYVLVARPPRFLEWVVLLYADQDKAPRGTS